MLRSSAKSYWVIDTHQSVSSKTKTSMNVTYLEFIRSTECTIAIVLSFEPIQSTSMSIHHYESYKRLLFFPKNITSSNRVMLRRSVKQTSEKQPSWTYDRIEGSLDLKPCKKNFNARILEIVAQDWSKLQLKVVEKLQYWFWYR